MDAEIRRRQQAAKTADEATEASPTAAPEGPPTPPPIGETPSTKGLLQRVSMRFRWAAAFARDGENGPQCIHLGGIGGGLCGTGKEAGHSS